MISKLIEQSVRNPWLVITAFFILSLFGLRAIKQTPVDAIPDLSEVQVIVKTAYPGQAPELVDQHISRPLSSALMSVPGAKTVRSFSFFGDSYIYVLFDDHRDPYWARSRVLEYLNQIQDQLPQGVKPQLGPDASGVGWIYIYALNSHSGQQNIAQLRSLQDDFLKYELQALPGVAEVASLGGSIKQYQIQVDPLKLQSLGIPLVHVQQAIAHNNSETGASVIELAEAEYMVRASGYITSATELAQTPLGQIADGEPLLIKDIATVIEAPSMRRGIAEFNGKGETVGGIIVMRQGENAQQTIAAVKNRLQELKPSLPNDVSINPVYDRSTLISRAINNLHSKVLQELAWVALVVFLFLFNARSSLVAVITLPVGILIAYLVMQAQGINANIMSLGGIAIAIGAMIDGAIVMLENLHKKFESQPDLDATERVIDSAKEVGPTLFFSLLIVTVSFLPVFSLEAEEGRLFKPLALTKTYAMAAAALITITLVPALMQVVLRSNFTQPPKVFALRPLQRKYQQLLYQSLGNGRAWLLSLVTALLITVVVFRQLPNEFMPPLDEGDLMYMPTTYPALSIGKAKELLQQSDQMILKVPEVAQVFGKIGRADTATDPAPLTMIESFIQLKPRAQWRAGMTTDEIIAELEQKVRIPGLSNAWVMPIKTRIDMLATGMKTPLGIKLAGPNIEKLQSLGAELEQKLQALPESISVYAERSAGGRYLNIEVNKLAAARYGLNLKQVQNWLEMAVGGRAIGETIEGNARYPISLRYPDDYRQTPEQFKSLPLLIQGGQVLSLGDIAEISIKTGPALLKSENAQLNTWLYIDIGDGDIGAYQQKVSKIIHQQMDWPKAYSYRWSGQYQNWQRAADKLRFIIPLTLVIIAFLLFLNFKRLDDVCILLCSLPFALVGALSLIYLLEFKISVAVIVGFIALAGLATETGAIMLQVLRAKVPIPGQADHSIPVEQASAPLDSNEQLKRDICSSASERLRPVLMTAVATIAGLLPVMFGHEPGVEVMSRIAAPVIGGLMTMVILSLFVIPQFFYWSIKMRAHKIY